MTIKDINHLEWVHERMQFVHNENENLDYMIRFKEIIEQAKKEICQYSENLHNANLLREKAYIKERQEIVQKSIELAEKANEKGYKSGKWIISDVFPTTPLRIGHGMVWSDNQEALVVGCTDEKKCYYTAVPIHNPKNDYWATLID